MLDALLTLLRPVEAAIAAVLARLHDLALALGLGPSPAWYAALVGLVLVVRAVLLPVVVRQVRLAHAAARARPHLEDITRRYAARSDPESLRRQLAETRAVRAEHGVSLGCLPSLVVGVVLFGLYRLLVDIAAGVPVGALDATLVASARAAELAGVGLATTLGTLGPTPAGLVAGGLGVAAALVSYASTRWLTLPTLPTPPPPSPSTAGRAPGHPTRHTRARRDRRPRPGADSPAPLLDSAQLAARVQGALPLVTALGLLVSAPIVPAGVLVYWLASATWTAGQQAVVNRVAPTPGSRAHAAYERRRQRDDGATPG